MKKKGFLNGVKTSELPIRYVTNAVFLPEKEAVINILTIHGEFVAGMRIGIKDDAQIMEAIEGMQAFADEYNEDLDKALGKDSYGLSEGEQIPEGIAEWAGLTRLQAIVEEIDTCVRVRVALREARLKLKSWASQ